ncbi:hypothetical protein MHI32_16105 [Paenibacillus sp. FSL H7-0690]|uniref:hypothetical protein n=1 Tax=Paenibacillus sp. FSL H7-0690 TaxID=2921437 RepID=UPI0030EF4DD0
MLTGKSYLFGLATLYNSLLIWGEVQIGVQYVGEVLSASLLGTMVHGHMKPFEMLLSSSAIQTSKQDLL